MDSEELHPTFTVDTHLFRELGELLVGRDSTALVELIKNSYDADATEVIVYGEFLDSIESGLIRIRDNGTGMSPADFRNGFLRIASRSKEAGDRRSIVFNRRFTGAKGVGRLAAHKLARVIDVESLRWDGKTTKGSQLRATDGVEASINWETMEKYPTLDALKGSSAITVTQVIPSDAASPGTTITLRGLRRKWSSAIQSRFLSEIQTFEPPDALVRALPKTIVERAILFDKPLIRDASKLSASDLFHVNLEGDFAPSEDFFRAEIDATSWIVEIDADKGSRKVKYGIAPTKATIQKYEEAVGEVVEIAHPEPTQGPFFQARILVRTGSAWGPLLGGVRVFMEGFRVLPYGEVRNDWLSLDRDVTERGRGGILARGSENPLAELLAPDEADETGGLLALPNKHYFGAVFLTQERSKTLRLLVNREGFVPDESYELLVTLVRAGIDLATRARASATENERRQRRHKRANRSSEDREPPQSAMLRASLEDGAVSIREARRRIGAGDVTGAKEAIEKALTLLEAANSAAAEVIGESAIIRILASVGTQMAAFVHEINGLVGMASSVDRALRRLKESKKSPTGRAKEQNEALARLTQVVTDLRRNLERQASYLVDVVAPEARRRRSRQLLAERFASGSQLVAHAAESRGIVIENGIPGTMKSPAMFPAELTTIFSNLLSNAVKAAGPNGRIRATASRLSNETLVRIENTGVRVDPKTGEKWFKPFASSTTKVDTVLGQGMGLGLPITRSVLAEYGATIRFVVPSKDFATALEIRLPA